MSALSFTVDASAVKVRINGTSGEMLVALRQTLEVETGNLETWIKSNKLSGQVLQQRSGNLKRAMFHTVSTAGPQMVGTVAVSNTAPYGAYQEFGANIPERVPVRAKALRWYVGGNPVFAMRARAFHLPARPWMIPSLQENAPRITAQLQAAVNKSLSD